MRDQHLKKNFQPDRIEGGRIILERQDRERARLLGMSYEVFLARRKELRLQAAQLRTFRVAGGWN